jgi:hypothetical protein
MKNMALKNKYICYLVILNGLLTTALLSSWNLFFEDVRPLVGIAFAMALFLLYETMIIVFTDKKSETITPRQSVNLFLGLKVGKIILSLLFIAVYAFAFKVELKRFILIFVILYFIYLLFDTIYLANREKELKIKKLKN